ncbi:MAG: hypothetical protein FWG96_05585 [Methanomassiliicoccaceae archaeon]|nr:hypothetical protein [Methanomassiliicoccaceae archaeon]
MEKKTEGDGKAETLSHQTKLESLMRSACLLFVLRSQKGRNNILKEDDSK